MNKKQLAAALGISGAMVTKLSQKGMPTSSVEAAEKWRRRHLEPSRTKAFRAPSMDPRRPGAAPRAAPLPVGPGDPETVFRRAEELVDAALRRVRDLGLLAHDALAGESFQLVAPMLRAAMAAVPAYARDRVALSVEVWDALTAAIPLDLGEDLRERVPAAGASSELPDDFMGTFWYQIALADLADHHLRVPPDRETPPVTGPSSQSRRTGNSNPDHSVLEGAHKGVVR